MLDTYIVPARRTSKAFKGLLFKFSNFIIAIKKGTPGKCGRVCRLPHYNRNNFENGISHHTTNQS